MAGLGTKVRATAVLLVVALVGIGAATAVDAAPRPAATTPPAEAEAGVQAVDALAGLVTNGPVYDIERVGDTTYLGGDFDYLGERTGPFVGISTATGDQTITFPTATLAGGVSDAKPDGSGGWYITGSGGSGVTHLDANGAVLWQAPVTCPVCYIGNISVSSVEVHDGFLLIAGRFTQVNGQPREGLAALDSSTGATLPWSSSLTLGNSNGFSDATLVGGVVYAVRQGPTFSFSAELRAVNYPSGTARPFNPPVPNGTRVVEYFDGVVMTNTGSWDEFGLSTPAPCPMNEVSSRVGSLLYTVSESGHGVVGCDLSTGDHFVEIAQVAGVNGISVGDGSLYVAQGNGEVKAFDATTGAPGWVLQSNGGGGRISASGSNVMYYSSAMSSIDVQQRGNLAAIDGTGAITPWAPTADGTVRSLAVDGNGIVVGGEFTNIDGTARSRLARIDRTSGVLDSWDPNANGTVLAVEVDSGVTFAGGQFTLVDSEAHNRLVAIDQDGHPVAGWATGANSTVTALEVFNGELYLGGGFQYGRRCEPSPTSGY